MHMQYYKNLSVEQISETEFLLRVTDRKLAGELRQRFGIFGRYIAELKPIKDVNGEVLEDLFKISGMDSVVFNRHFNTLATELFQPI
ncbi:hypothetical protein QTA56_07900 [Acinetobacter sp. VNH17]|uniref:Uncharacterized protein n=1 Tax=Acinetobacter thutiue TaxID=2998078 RepID=A0ABT7WNB4_9GAMM|nr:hypothetical protein [Acinetobacter thutiue]MCY6412055.1 hypothetical protein [Acinetobacter thutiue]MDN0014159.1 hypothetical protein [Acinetobacter thutiue]